MMVLCCFMINWTSCKGLYYGYVLLSSGASVLAGLIGGIAMAVTIPADVVHYYAMALKLAQELGYIYGSPNIVVWKG